MLLVYILTWILESQHIAAAVTLWGWFGDHIVLTILMLLFLA